MTLPDLLYRVAFHRLESAYLVRLLRDTGLLLHELGTATDDDRRRAALAVLRDAGYNYDNY